jgi:hypothetical protein
MSGKEWKQMIMFLKRVWLVAVETFAHPLSFSLIAERDGKLTVTRRRIKTR